MIPPPKKWGQTPKFLNLIYKIEHTSRHVAKFRGNRPTDLGDFVAKKNKNFSKTKTQTCLAADRSVLPAPTVWQLKKG